MTIWNNHDMLYPDYVHVSVIGHHHSYFAIMHFVKEAVDAGYKPSTAQQSACGQVLDGGHIEVKNPVDGPRHLILSYMATGLATSKYPMVDIM
eukprot:4063508-Ditylum_brightwellii.AAC.1